MTMGTLPEEMSFIFAISALCNMVYGCILFLGSCVLISGVGPIRSCVLVQMTYFTQMPQKNRLHFSSEAFHASWDFDDPLYWPGNRSCGHWVNIWLLGGIRRLPSLFCMLRLALVLSVLKGLASDRKGFGSRPSKLN